MVIAIVDNGRITAKSAIVIIMRNTGLVLIYGPTNPIRTPIETKIRLIPDAGLIPELV